MKPAPLKIGPITIETPTILAPMAGYTDWPFRLLCREQQCGLVVTEVVSADGVLYDSPRTRHYTNALPQERPIGIQLYGGDPDKLARAAVQLEALNRFDFIDINCGCPVPKIITKGAGVALMRDPEKLSKLVRAVKDAVSIPVTAKTRIGLSPKLVNISEVSQAIEEGGAEILAIHARFASNRHDGDADWNALAEIKAQRSIPIIGNGGIHVAQDAPDMIEQTGVDGVMIGRAAIGNPWIFAEIHALWNDLPFSPPTLAERRDMIMRHVHSLIEMIEHDNQFRKKVKYTAEETACQIFRAHIIKYMSGFRGWRAMTRELNDLKSLESIKTLVETILADDAIADEA